MMDINEFRKLVNDNHKSLSFGGQYPFSNIANLNILLDCAESKDYTPTANMITSRLNEVKQLMNNYANDSANEEKRRNDLRDTVIGNKTENDLKLLNCDELRKMLSQLPIYTSPKKKQDIIDALCKF